MAVRKPSQGAVEAAESNVNTWPEVADTLDFLRFLSVEGMQVVLTAIPGLTSPDILRSPFHFQCAPVEALSRRGSYGWEDYTTLAGQQSRPQGRQLDSITVSTLFVDYVPSFRFHRTDAPGQITENPNPILATRYLEAVRDSGRPFRLMIVNPALWGNGLAEVNMPATLRDLTIEERPGEVDARYVSATFTEHRDPRKVRIDRPDLPATRRIADLPANLNTLFELATFYYGDPSKWQTIKKHNGMTGVAGKTNLKTKYAKQKQKRVTVPRIGGEATPTETGTVVFGGDTADGTF